MEPVIALARQFGGEWAVAIIFVFGVLYKTGILQWLITWPVSVRRQLALENQQIIDNIGKEWASCRERVIQLEARNEVLDRRNDSLTRDAGRWRHAAADFAAKLEATREHARRNGFTPLPIKNLDSLFELREAEGGDDFLAMCERLFFGESQKS